MKNVPIVPRPAWKLMLAALLNGAPPAAAHASSAPATQSVRSELRHEAVRVHSGRVVLAATLVAPAGEGPHPTPALEQIRVPVLAVYAELDPEVPPEPNVALLSAALARAGNTAVTIHVFPQANHLFWVARTGLRDEYTSLREEYVPGYLDMVGGWILQRAHAR
jgi:pimeloyl-ACP methyl ester carboxylesterase